MEIPNSFRNSIHRAAFYKESTDFQAAGVSMEELRERVEAVLNGIGMQTEGDAGSGSGPALVTSTILTNTFLSAGTTLSR